MTVAELIEELKTMNQNSKVHIAYPSGDYWRTELAPEAKSVSYAEVRWSEYHSTTQICESDYENGLPVVVVGR